MNYFLDFNVGLGHEALIYLYHRYILTFELYHVAVTITSLYHIPAAPLRRFVPSGLIIGEALPYRRPRSISAEPI